MMPRLIQSFLRDLRKAELFPALKRGLLPGVPNGHSCNVGPRQIPVVRESLKNATTARLSESLNGTPPLGCLARLGSSVALRTMPVQ